MRKLLAVRHHPRRLALHCGSSKCTLWKRGAASRLVSAVVAGLLAGVVALAQAPPPPTELPGKPFFIKQKWMVGGAGDWGYLALDANARQLFIAHGQSVQVVDLETGTLAGEIGGFSQAYAIALDEAGQFGYASDSRAGNVTMFSRRSMSVVAKIPTPVPPRDLIFEPQTGLVFAVGSVAVATAARRTTTRPAPPENAGYPCGLASDSSDAPRPESVILALDPEHKRVAAAIRVCGAYDAMRSDDTGTISAVNRSEEAILQFEAQALQDLAGKQPANGTLILDWRRRSTRDDGKSGQLQPRRIVLGGGCREPRGLAVDGAHARLFVACSNRKLAVIDTGAGQVAATVPIDYGADSVAYDPARELIYAASGAGAGSLTIVQRHVTDSYAVVQTLPTLPNARTMAIDSSTGEVDLVTALDGVKLGAPPFNGIGTLQIQRVDATFQVLVVGN